MINNLEFERQLKNIEYIKIMNAVIKKYKRYLDIDEINQIKKIALFNALRTYDPSRETKFETHLHNQTIYGVLSHIKREYRQNRLISYIDNIENILTENTYDDIYTHDTVNMILNSLNSTDRDMIHCKYIHNMTLAEIGKKYNVSRETIRLKINKIIEKIKHDTRVDD